MRLSTPPPRDIHGQPLSAGCLVTVLGVASCASGLPLEDQERLLGVVGERRRLVRFDRSGMPWFCFKVIDEQTGGENAGDFCLLPEEVALVA